MRVKKVLHAAANSVRDSPVAFPSPRELCAPDAYQYERTQFFFFFEEGVKKVSLVLVNVDADVTLAVAGAQPAHNDCRLPVPHELDADVVGCIDAKGRSIVEASVHVDF